MVITALRIQALSLVNSVDVSYSGSYLGLLSELGGLLGFTACCLPSFTAFFHKSIQHCTLLRTIVRSLTINMYNLSHRSRSSRQRSRLRTVVTRVDRSNISQESILQPSMREAEARRSLAMHSSAIASSEYSIDENIDNGYLDVFMVPERPSRGSDPGLAQLIAELRLSEQWIYISDDADSAWDANIP